MLTEGMTCNTECQLMPELAAPIHPLGACQGADNVGLPCRLIRLSRQPPQADPHDMEHVSLIARDFCLLVAWTGQKYEGHVRQGQSFGTVARFSSA